MNPLALDLELDLVAEAPAPSRAWNNFTSFKRTGCIAKITQYCCEFCGSRTSLLEGLFHEEVHLPSGGRRLFALAAGEDPPPGSHRVEYSTHLTPFCTTCIKDLGFDQVAGVSPATTFLKEA